ncbi:hypothetical protein DNTS_015652 [Danionella cerebrum]|uniref:Uncharacterized protein n=1 Tax=Danionella cerebrum TaxID=2873325 RepID=A0A553Q6B6_9TELE|nr:hypothetical protein DNTS_015652 [Danionella translucida]
MTRFLSELILKFSWEFACMELQQEEVIELHLLPNHSDCVLITWSWPGQKQPFRHVSSGFSGSSRFCLAFQRLASGSRNREREDKR